VRIKRDNNTHCFSTSKPHCRKCKHSEFFNVVTKHTVSLLRVVHKCMSGIILNVVKTETAVLPSRIGSPHTESRKLNPCFYVTENHIYNSVIFLPVINTLMLKVLTCIEKAGFAEALNRMFTGEWNCVKRLHSPFPCRELKIKRLLIAAVVPSHYVLINSRTRS
jgi:hypothetical protein